MMTREAVMEIVAREARIDPDKLAPDATLASLGIASLDVVSVLFAIEDEAGVEIPIEAVQAADTLGGFVDIVVDKVSAA